MSILLLSRTRKIWFFYRRQHQRDKQL